MGFTASASDVAWGFPAGKNKRNQNINVTIFPITQIKIPFLGCLYLKKGQYIVPATQRTPKEKHEPLKAPKIDAPTYHAM